MSDNFESSLLEEYGNFDEDELLRGLFDDVDDGFDLVAATTTESCSAETPTTTAETPLKPESTETPTKSDTAEEKVTHDGNESVISASSGYQSLSSIDSPVQQLEYPENVTPLKTEKMEYPMNNYYYQQYPEVPAQMMHRPQLNQQYYHEVPAQMMQRPPMNQQYYQYVYYPNQMQPQQNGYYHPNGQVQWYPYQTYYAPPTRMPLTRPHYPQLAARLSSVPAYLNQQQQHYPTQPLPQIRQIVPKSMLQGFQTSNPEALKTFEMPSTSSKLVMSAVDKDESRSTRAPEPYKIPVNLHPKPKDRQVTGEAALLEVNRLQFRRWHKCVEYMKTYLSTAHELIPFIVFILEKSETSNDMIQWRERTKKFEHDRAFEFKNKDEIVKAYLEVSGKEIKYTGIVTRLTKLCNIRFDGCPVFQKTKQRNTYEIFPTLIPSHDGTACPIQIVNGLPVETDYI